jgi:formylglycine-generating enzyme required for sulfatase activity
MQKLTTLCLLSTIHLLFGLTACSVQDESIPASMTDAKGVQIILVPGGTFTLGMSVEDGLQACYDRIAGGSVTDDCSRIDFEVGAPPRGVSIDAFWMDTFEVTFAQFKQCVQDEVCDGDLLSFFQNHGFTDDNLPIVGLTNAEAATMCEWRGARLPSEAEWEFAARGPDSLPYPWGSDFDGANTNLCDADCERIYDYLPSPTWSDGYALMAPVGSFPEDVSWIGIHDLMGNVAEWTSTPFQPYAPEVYPLDELNRYFGGFIPRGGSYETPATLATTAYRLGAPDSNFSSLWLGFRCVRPASE